MSELQTTQKPRNVKKFFKTLEISRLFCYNV